MEPEVSLCLGSVAGVGSLLAKRNASMAMSPLLMVRMCVGPWGEGANRTRHLVFGGRRLDYRGRPLGRFRAVVAGRAGVVILPLRLMIDVISNPWFCWCCVSCREHSFGSHWTMNSFTYVYCLLFLTQRGGHLSSTRLMPS